MPSAARKYPGDVSCPCGPCGGREVPGAAGAARAARAALIRSLGDSPICFAIYLFTYSELLQSYAEDQKSCWNEFFSYSKHLQTAQMPSSFRTLTHEIFGLENQ